MERMKLTFRFCPRCGAAVYPLKPWWLTCHRGHHYELNGRPV